MLLRIFQFDAHDISATHDHLAALVSLSWGKGLLEHHYSNSKIRRRTVNIYGQVQMGEAIPRIQQN